MKLSAKICLALGGVIFLIGAYLSVVAIRGDYIWTIEPPILGVGLILLGCGIYIYLHSLHVRNRADSEVNIYATAEPVQPEPEEQPEEVKSAENPQPHDPDPRWGFPLAAAILFSIYTIIEIFFVRGNGLDQDWVFENSITAAFLGGAGSSMLFAMIATGLLWAGIASNRSGIYMTGMIVVCVCAALWLMHIYLSALPLILGWIGYAKMRRAERARR